MAPRRLALTVLVIGMAAILCYEAPTELGRHREDQIIQIIAVALVAWVASRHVFGLAQIVLVTLPVQLLLLSVLYRLGVPRQLVRVLGFGKEALVLGLVVAAVRERRRVAPSVTERFAVAFVLLCLFFAVLGYAGAAPTKVNSAAIVTAVRVNVFFVIGFIAARRVTWPQGATTRLLVASVVPVPLLAAGAIWERVANVSFNHFVISTIRYPTYSLDVLGDAVRFATASSTTDTSAFRVGSWQFDSLSLGFVLVLPLAIAFYLTATRVAVWWSLIFGMAAASLFFTITRSAILGGGVACVLLAAGAARVRARGRARFLVIGVIGLALLLPVAGAASVFQRIGGAFGGNDQSTKDHSSRSSTALQRVIDHPLGGGLGSNPASVQRNESDQGAKPAENAYLQVGLETGVEGMALFVGMALSAQRELSRRRGGRGALTAAAPIWAGGWGLAVVGFFLHVWTNLPTAVGFWLLVGVALSELPVADPAPATERSAGGLAHSRPRAPAISAS